MLQMILWDIATQSLNKKGKKKCVYKFLFWKLHNKNAKIDVLNQNFLHRLNMVGGTSRKFPKVKFSPLTIFAPWQVCSRA